MDQEPLALRDVLHILRHYRWLIVTAVAVAVLAALIISFAQPKRYTAETQLVVGPTIPDAALPDAPAGADAGPLGLDLPAETQARIVASPIMTARVAKILGLSPDPEEIKELTKRIQAKAVTDNLLLITVNAPTSVEAAAMANGYATAYLEYRQEAARDSLQALSGDEQRRARDAQQRINELDQQINAATARGARSEVDRLTSERNALQDDLRALTRRSRSLASAQASEFSGGKIIAPAVPPAQSSSPNPIRNVLIALVLGGAAGVSISLLREHVNDRVATRDDAARAANAPVLAALPNRPLSSMVTTEDLVTITAPEAMASEAYRQLHRNLVRRGLGTQIRRLLVTSVESGSETSQTVANLGVLCARTGQPTMAIAANLRHSRLHAYFHISSKKPGLATALANEDWEGETALSALSMALSVAERNLLVLPSGTVKFNPGEVFSSARLGEILNLAVDMAQVLIIEAPPILSSDDALTLAAHADAVLLVLKAGVDKEGLTARAATILETAGSTLIGVVLHNAQKDDETVGWFERDRIGRDHLPATPSDGKWEFPHVGNGHRSEKASAADPDRPRLAIPEPHDDS
jgi:capsular exopolysaccharide synthesis family protein